MSILINDIKMPTSCLECPLTDGHSASCLITEQSVYFFVNKRHNDCPLVPVPPHGRLIDADKIPYKKIMLDDNEFYYGVTQPYIDRMPTIIPAEDGE